MLLSIDHRTDYAFDQLARTSVQYVRLTPRQDPVQTVSHWSLHTNGRASAWRDGFGNIVHCVVHHDPHAMIELHVQGQIDTVETHGVVPYDSQYDLSAEFYLRSTPLTEIDDDIRDFVRQFSTFRAKKNTLRGLHALMGGIHDHIAYVPGETSVGTRAPDVLTLGRGVCQDHAHLFIACCRAWGIPARYVSGYLHSDSQDGRHLATHAWAEALVEDLGWVSFDPSNRQSATQAYVRLAVALDYLGAAPVRGMRLGGGSEEMSVRVHVQQGECQQQ